MFLSRGNGIAYSPDVDDRAFLLALPDWVEAGWGRAVRLITPSEPGMNSYTAIVELDLGRFAAKWVRTSSTGALDAGSDIARRLSRYGIATGAPLITSAGALSHPTVGGSLALLRYVPGRPLTGTNTQEQTMMADILARVHAVDSGTRAEPFMADLLELVHDVEPWIRPSFRAVLAEQAQLSALTWGTLHTDSAHEAFRYDEQGDQVGLIDWSGATEGPLLYDVALALMYLGGRSNSAVFWKVYRDSSPAPETELIEYIAAFTRLRAAVQAARFSMRVATADPIGIADQSENVKGLRDARRMLIDSGVAPR